MTGLRVTCSGNGWSLEIGIHTRDLGALHKTAGKGKERQSKAEQNCAFLKNEKNRIVWMDDMREGRGTCPLFGVQMYASPVQYHRYPMNLTIRLLLWSIYS